MASVHDEALSETHESDRWRGAGDRIEALLDSASAGGPVARERAEQLVREVVDLYGEALGRILAVAAHAPGLVDELARDELVSSMLLVSGLHPHDVETRVRTALDNVRPYLGSHGGDVELVEVSDDGVVRLRLLGSCHGCPSSAVTLQLAVEGAVQAAAPETTAIEVETDASEPASATPGVFSADSLMSHVRDTGQQAGTWVSTPEFEELEPGEVGGFTVAGIAMLVCRIGDELFAYRDRCPACGNSMAGAVMQRRAGGPVGDAVLRCPVCRAHYDVRRAGAAVEASGDHLDPLPVLVRDGVLSVAVPTAVTG
ncbi:NifU family protein [Prescottella agglutinans]|uniref:Fe-S cluster biogenesis protein NfuA/nitrite reductase/ring-hydroxylating ferredoxin subunit n=1 Tax=Prescottella agglutinans TaxID=1644129 RepID=A0ABT6M7V4_9NOCA|nr:NifU family protein [Prescottella agglutinans]MDH6280373.1 Fe-S cluster biogenesis protein NfuA/nitrite reductase/ring-hydroxylating ferredoxin subunit [Prescottella agglutinans]